MKRVPLRLPNEVCLKLFSFEIKNVIIILLGRKILKDAAKTETGDANENKSPSPPKRGLFQFSTKFSDFT